MKQNGFTARVVKTTKVEVDEKSHRLPPDNGSYDEYKVADYFCPDEWSNDGVFIPVKEGDPLWFDFQGNDDECAILCAVQRINPVTGDPADLDAGLSKDPVQNYLRMPEQRWLDGYAKDGKVYQFVVTKAGVGLAVNEFVLPKHMQDSHAIGFAFFGPKNPKPKPVVRTHLYSGGPYMKSALHDNIKYGSSGGSWNCTSGGLSSGGIKGIDMDYDNLVGSSDMMGIDGGEPEIFCCNSASGEGTTVCDFDEGIPMAAGGAAAAEMEEIETVDILAAQEADLTELDKASMGAGGRITQRIETDDNTTDYYHEKRSALLTIYFALPEMFDAIMKKGKRQDASKKDKYKTSGHIGGVAVPLVTGDE